jgi:uncharacterized protein YkwD
MFAAKFRLLACIAAIVFMAPSSAHAQAATATRLIDYINAARVQNGLRALPENIRLTQAARTHARDMAENGFVDHKGSDDSNLQDRVTRTGYAWTLVAENVAAGQKTVQEVVQGWMKSPGHRKNILNEEVRELGAGHVSNPNVGVGKNYTHFWVVVFGRR